jgi:hypothetical protein
MKKKSTRVCMRRFTPARTLPTPAKPFLVSLFAVVQAFGDEIVRAQPVADRRVEKIFT